ncbi:ATP-binding protein [Clostridium uliginosum]|uniref:histidine kinase n=1 Tax=Clostridium uliginosum TaxID=119641 RepID=A0A1I1ND91_9CLOT|nr:ATP-binding protein [Clostridium uliginosum]SFC91720.1 Signal transduction histidine kinase [Clostridium uliginosum]
MSIRKKCLIFVFIIVIVPMFLIFLLSNIILNNQIEKSAQGYLENAFMLANNEMIDRLNEMKKVSIRTTKSTEFQKEIQSENVSTLNKTIKGIDEVYDYIDFYMVFDEKKILMTSEPNIKDSKFSRLNMLIDKAESTHNTITSEELFNINDLFYDNSKEYNKFKVLINKENDESEYLTKCLVAITISPVYDNEKDNPIGFLVIGSVVNNDDYFPKTYSKSVENSYLAISVEGIRVASNVRSPKKENYIGSSIPIGVSTVEKEKNSYYGKQSIDGEIHIFLDKTILDCDGNIVGVLGVGIPEYKFSIIMNTQRGIIIFVCIFSLAIMLFLCKYASNKITAPIIKATELANQISKGNNEVVIDERFLEEKNSETTILLKAFQKMADDLKCAENQRVIYLQKLRNEQFEQQKLSKQLYILNESLEEKVKLRTEDLREAIISLKKAGKVKSLFLANMSHELRTPLSAIITCSEILKEGIFGPLNEKQLKHVGNIFNSGNHLLKLINDVLDISKIEAGKMTLMLGVYSISDVVVESFSIVKSLAYRKNIDISININPSDFTIKVDANKLKQILYNLLSNAIKFTPKNGKVVVELIKNGDYMQITVEDNGIGIKEEDQKRIFNEFEQVDNSYERQYEGTGLGLPLTKKLVEMHGGEIFLVSQINNGTKVIITLPINIDKNMNSSN